MRLSNVESSSGSFVGIMSVEAEAANDRVVEGVVGILGD